ncbi:unnamed protein product [Soboliphyme baturini]|uniref:HOOK_N domain-containing protein n=1 Tax=Soboliphyme baturini TaxID=241478 RepID=A0A183IM56_9BILA|nr:unnamed protein product [Soboliphyme baturini]
MKKLLLLLLGSAVQSEKKEEFVNQIKNLDVNLQQSIVEEIRKVTQDADYVVNVQQMATSEFASHGGDGGDGTKALLHSLVRLVEERNSYAHLVLDLNQEQESDASSVQSMCSGLKLPESQQHEMRDDFAERHTGIEVADLKAKLRRMRQDLEEKIEIIGMHKEDIVEKDEIIMKLRKENLELTKEMRASKDYRDEVDMLREKVDGVERLEKECQKYKEKLMEMNFYKSRVEELRQENDVLIETKNMLEDQIGNLRQRLLQSSTCEAEVLRLQRMISNLQQDMKMEHERMDSVLDDNSRLQKELRESMKKACDLERELDRMKSPIDSPTFNDGAVARSISDQMNDSLNSKLLRLELENQKLQGKLDECKEHQPSTLSVYKAENEELRQTVNALREQNAKDSSKMSKQQESNLQLLQTVNRLEKELQSRDEQHRFDVEQLKAEVAQSSSDKASCIEAALAKTKNDLETARTRSDDLEVQNDQLNSKNRALESEVLRLKSDVNQLHDQLNVAISDRSTLEGRLSSVERENRCLEKENLKFKHLLQCSDAESESRRSRVVDLERRVEELSSLQTECVELKKAHGEAEADKKAAYQQLDIERRKATALGDDLINEKRRCRQLEDHVRYVRSCLSLEPPGSNDDFDQFNECVARCVADLRNQILALQSRCLQKEKEIEQLTDSNAIASVPVAPYDHSGNGSSVDDRTQRPTTDSESTANAAAAAVAATADLTNKNFLLIEENRNVRHQVFILQDQIKRLQDDVRTVRNENALLRQQIRDLQIQLCGSETTQSVVENNLFCFF